MSKGFYYFVVFCCFFSTLLVSINFIVIRKMKHIHYTVINGFYGIALTIISIFIFTIYSLTRSDTVHYNFGASEWMYIILIGFATAFGNQLIISAVTFDKAGRLASLSFI
jgi:uncharacterized membrane protein